MPKVKCPSPRMRRQPLHSRGVKEESPAHLSFEKIMEESDTSEFEDIKQDISEKEVDSSDNKMRLMKALKHSLLPISPVRSKMEGSHEVAGGRSALYRSPDLSCTADKSNQPSSHYGKRKLTRLSSLSSNGDVSTTDTIADLFTPERKNGEIGQDQTSQAGSIGRDIVKIEKINKEIVMEVEKSNKNLGIRKQKMEDLVEKQTLDKKILAKKYKEELSLLEKNQRHEITTLQETLAIENRDEQRYIASLKEHRDELVQEFEKLTNDAGNRASSHERSKLEPITRSLECPVCMELMRPPTKIWMCRFTHVICEVCKDHLRAVGGNCPTCTTEPFIGRNYMAEDLARTVFNE